ncbi:MAG: hypothetical protein COA73_14515 [Candidatus Hydrogenedentota bacterium]|nr:MAG: hypothetical protein COA73_14515 [Candidatus Hydrogenedentota bacterium]
MSQKTIFFRLLFSMVLLVTAHAGAQAVKGTVAEGASPPPLTYHGLTPGVTTHAQVREVLGEPVDESKWYNYKMYYPAKDRPGLFDIVHILKKRSESSLAGIEASSIPAGYETGNSIRRALGEPEYELRMVTWKLLDYSEQGLRFSLTSDGKTTGVSYFPYGHRRVPEGERHLVDLSHLREGPQPKSRQAPQVRSLSAGFSEVIFSPQGKDWLGYKYKVHDDLKARIAVFDDGQKRVALVGADLFGMGWNETYVMREGARKLGVDQTVIAMSHNHAAGDTIGVYGHYPAEYIAHIQKQVLHGIELAIKNMKPVKELRTNLQELPMDGARVQGLFRNARNPAVLDPTISTVQVVGDDGNVMGTLVHFACHVESLRLGAREISADFPGYMCEQIKQDGGGQPVFLNGAMGGMVSGDNRARTHESSREMGLQLAAIVKDMADTAQPAAVDGITLDMRPLEIPMVNPNFQPLFESGLRSLHRGRVQTDMQYIRIGEIEMISLPGELLPELSFEILEKMNGFPRMLIGLANDALGYMIPPYDFRAGAYEESVSQGPSAGLQVRDMALLMITENAPAPESR